MCHQHAVRPKPAIIRIETTPTEAEVHVMYKVVKGHMPAINIEHFLRAHRPKHTMWAKQFEDFVKKNIVEKSVCNNNQCFKPITAKSDQFRNFFFVQRSLGQFMTGISSVKLQ